MSTVNDSLPNEHLLPRLLLRTEEAAEALGVSRTKIYHLIQEQRLESVRIGGSRRIPMDCLIAYVEKMRDDRQTLVRR